MSLLPFRLIPLRWKLAAVAALSSRVAPTDFPLRGPRLIVALAADYGNLGDVALTRALIRFAAIYLPSHQPYLLPAGRVFRDLRGVALAAGPDDVVALVGGGNMGDLYPDLEDARLRVVKAFPRQRIVSFPQSIGFSDTPTGRRALVRSRAVYESHPHLELFARERESFDRMRQAFPFAKVSLAPDTVLSLDVPLVSNRTLPLMVCLRQDKEAALASARRDALMASLAAAYPGAHITDTLVDGPRLDFQAYNRHLDTFLAQLTKSRCMVTDRLHGLIFSVITGTPCVVIENNNHKICAAVESWLRDVPTVKLLSNPESGAVQAAIAQVVSAPVIRPDFVHAFRPLAQALRV
jgi:pyruvyl transferase EpsI